MDVCSALKVGFLGGGSMAKAMAGALVREGVCSAPDICMSARTEASLDAIKALGHGTGSNIEVAEMAKHGLLFVTVKPESATQVLAEVKDSLSSVSLVVSACAGVPLSRLASAAGEVPIARIMPNLLCTIREGATSYCMHNCGETEEALLLRVLQAFGPAYKIPEHQFDAFCAISGSSPAFVATFIEALIDGGVQCGLPRQLATEAALQSVRGTAILLQSEKLHTALLRDKITSPGGTTIAGLFAMERRAFRAAVAEAVKAASDRSKEIQSSSSRLDDQKRYVG